MSGSDYTFTPNYSLYKPVTNADVDVWGDHWNINADTIDAQMHVNQQAAAAKLPLAGGTMTGAITLAGNATANLQAVTLQQMNAAISSAGSNYLPLAGGTVTGDLTVWPGHLRMSATAVPSTAILGSAFIDSVAMINAAWNAYIDTGGWKGLGQNAVEAAASVTTTGLDFYVAPNVVAGAAPAWTTPLQLTSAADAIFGRAVTIRQNIVSTSPAAIRFNAYVNAAGNSTYYENGPAAVASLDNSTGFLRFAVAASGTANTQPSFPTNMTLDSTGTLTLNAGTSNGSIGLGARGSGINDCLNIWATLAGDGGIVAVRGPTYSAPVQNATQIYAGPASARKTWDFRQDGGLYAPGDITAVNLHVGSVYATGDVTVGNALYINYPTVSDFVIMRSGGLRYFRWRSDGWDDIWRESDGLRYWNTPTTTLMSLNGSASLWVAGEFRTPGNVFASGYVSANVLLGGPAGNAGTLQSWGSANKICFRWSGSAVEYRVDENANNFVCSMTNCKLLGYASGGGGPVGVVLNGYDMGGTVYGINCTAVSDARIKNNIVDTDVDALAAVLAIPVRQFDIKAEIAAHFAGIGKSDEERAQLRADAKPAHVPIGMVTQEIQPHVPEAVFVNPPNENLENPLPDDVQTLRLDQFIPYLVRSVQQLAASAAVADARLAALEQGH